jgi:DNA-binding transcriptional regulator YiaG
MDSRYLVYTAPRPSTKSSGAGKSRIWDAQRVRALRYFLQLTQEEFSQRLGTTQQNVSEWERGKHRPRGMSAIMLEKVAVEAGFEPAAPSAGVSAWRENTR